METTIFFWLFWTCGCFNPSPTGDTFFWGCMLSVGATILKQKWKYEPRKVSIAVCSYALLHEVIGTETVYVFQLFLMYHISCCLSCNSLDKISQIFPLSLYNASDQKKNPRMVCSTKTFLLQWFNEIH